MCIYYSREVAKAPPISFHGILGLRKQPNARFESGLSRSVPINAVTTGKRKWCQEWCSINAELPSHSRTSAPAQIVQQPADMIDVIVHAKASLDVFSHARTGPTIGRKSGGPRALEQLPLQSLALP